MSFWTAHIEARRFAQVNTASHAGGELIQSDKSQPSSFGGQTGYTYIFMSLGPTRGVNRQHQKLCKIIMHSYKTVVHGVRYA